MKITKAQLKQIIKEELDAVNEVSIADVAAMSDVERLMIVVKALGMMAFYTGCFGGNRWSRREESTSLGR